MTRHKARPLTTAEVRVRLRAQGLKATAARVAVMRALAAAARPLAHAEIVSSLRDAELDRATVFRNLVDLTRVGLVARRDLGDHIWRFELLAEKNPQEAEHPHFCCVCCGSVSCLPQVRVQVVAAAGAPQALAGGPVEVHLRGICDGCQIARLRGAS